MNVLAQFVAAVFTKRLASVAAVLLCIFCAFCATAQDKIVIRGSNTIGEELAPRLVAEYKKNHPHVAFDLETKGTSYGIGALMGGYCDIAGASKEIGKEQQEIAQIRGVHFKEYVIGWYTVSVIVNAANPVNDLSSNQVQGLFTGKIKNWKKVGGADAPVNLVIRDPISGTYIGFKELAMAYQDYGPRVQLFTNYIEIAKAVAKDPHAIGYIGLDAVPTEGIKVVSINGVMPSAAAINAHKYPYARLLRFYTNADKESPAARDFINFVLSPAGQAILMKMGYAPKP